MLKATCKQQPMHLMHICLPSTPPGRLIGTIITGFFKLFYYSHFTGLITGCYDCYNQQASSTIDINETCCTLHKATHI